ncbi:MAG: DUF58 domain-containing protein [Deltaproteobacteria bacterium]|nr:DUF58 domain-containing protein [Deltaproteobacteria bacterium]
MRRLYITKSGYWYIVLTIAIGVVSIASGNNVLYLIECLLLGGMILSGVVSEKAISSLEVTLVRRQAVADSSVRDEVVVRNDSRLPFFCIEILELSAGEFVPIALVPKIEAAADGHYATTRKFSARGVHEWQGLGVATAGPFGFARKVRILPHLGQRTVWPAAAGKHGATAQESARMGTAVADCEIRAFNPGDDDARLILWKLSGKTDDPVVRKKVEENPDVLLTLDLRVPAGEAFEKEICRLANSIYRAGKAAESEVRLVARGQAKTTRVSGYKPVLDYLSAVRAEGGA